MNTRLPKGLFLLAVVCASIYYSHYYPLLPQIVASHFDLRGMANGWQRKQAFAEIFAGMTLLAAFLVFGVPSIIRIMPGRLINLPNKEYWLGAERRYASMQFLSGWFAWFGCAVFALILIAFDYAMQSNLHSARGVNPARLWYGLGGFAGFTVIWTIRLVGRFGRLPK